MQTEVRRPQLSCLFFGLLSVLGLMTGPARRGDYGRNTTDASCMQRTFLVEACSARSLRRNLYTDWMPSHFSRCVVLIFIAAVGVTTPTLAQNGDRPGESQEALPAEWQVNDAPIRSAAEELKTFNIVDGYEIQLVASEPLVEAPVAFEFGPDGRMWVLEMRGYMRDAEGAGEREPLGRVKVLRDTDADGTMDHAEIFIENLVMPRAIALWRDGLLVIEPPYLLFCRDTNGDGTSDESRVVASGFAGADNPEHAGNGLLFSLDNTFVCSQHPVRFIPDDISLIPEPVSPHGQWGISEDAVGRLYYSPNSDPLLVDLVPKAYAARNPSQKSFDGVPSRAASDMRVFPSHLTPGVNRAYQKGVLRDGRLANFTGACSPHIHDGVALGADMQNCALICEVAGNLIHRYRISEVEGKVVATPADGTRSFWTSTDERFRPVFCASGTDGNIYVADMYRGIIQHRKFMTTFLREQIDARGLAQPVDAGRIWRVVRTNAGGTQRESTQQESTRSESTRSESTRSESNPAPNLAIMTSTELVTQLLSPEKPVREVARRLLIERDDRAVRDALIEQLRTTANRTARLETLWTLAGVHAVDAETVSLALTSDDAMTRVHAIRVAERSLDSATLASMLTRVIHDQDIRVRAQAVLSVGALDVPLRMAILETALRRDVGSKEMRSAVISAMAGAEGELLEAILAGRVLAADSIAARAFAAEFSDLLLDDGSGLPNPSTLSRTVEAVVAVAQERPWLAQAILDRVAAKQQLNAREPRQLIASQEPLGWFAMLDRLPVELQIATPIDRNIFWIGREDVSFIAPVIAKAATMSVADFGKRLFSNCMSCHQANGRGLPPVYPPLRGSEIVLGDPAVLTKILLHGLEGRIEVDGQLYNQVMPAAPIRGDDEIAAVLTYVRSAWGNAADPIDSEFVAKIREETKGRNRLFTSKELGIEAR